MEPEEVAAFATTTVSVLSSLQCKVAIPLGYHLLFSLVINPWGLLLAQQ